MPSQTISLGVQPFGISNDTAYEPTTRPLVIPALVSGGGPAYLGFVERLGTSIRMYFDVAQTGGSPSGVGPDLTDLWETYESAIVLRETGGASITLRGPNHPDNTFSDATEAYFWTPANGAALGTWITGLGTGEIRLTLDDGAGDATMLTLADFDTTGRDVDAAALLRASGNALPVPGNIYTDPDDGGTDSPLDGELGLGAGEVVISRLRRQESNSLPTLTLNERDNPEALTIGDYFDDGGPGDDLTMTIQTLTDSASMTAAADYRRGGGSFAHWTLTPEFRAIVDAIATGDLFILALWRESVDHPVDAGDISIVVAVPEPTITHLRDHEIDAGDISITIDIPEPTITRTGSHAVDAGDVSVTVDIPEPTITHLRNHEVDAGDISIVVAVPEPTITHAATVDRDVAVEIRTGSPTVTITAGIEEVMSSAPRSVRGVEVSRTTARVEWEAPADTGGLPVLRYEVRLDSGAWIDTGSARTVYTFTGLMVGTSYRVGVRAVTLGGFGMVSEEQTFTTETLYPEVTALPNDRLDLIAGRVYPDVALSEGIRMLVWANTPGPLGHREQADGTVQFGLPFVFDGGEVLIVPPFASGEYGGLYEPPAFNPDVGPLDDVSYIDQDTGGRAPSMVSGLAYIAYHGIQRRLNTEHGRQIMQPNYGLDFSSLVGHSGEAIAADRLDSAIRESLNGLDGADVSQVIASLSQGGVLDVRIEVVADSD